MSQTAAPTPAPGQSSPAFDACGAAQLVGRGASREVRNPPRVLHTIDRTRLPAGCEVVITGGRGGLGAAVVEAFLAAGARCHLPVRAAEPGTSVAGVTVTGGVDLTDEASVTSYYAGLPPLWASIHLAGGFVGHPILETSLEELRGQLDLNLVTAFLCAREAVRNMRRSPGGGGRIVNVSSRAAQVPSGGAIAYGAAKAAVNLLTAAIADEVKSDGILVNAVAPSIIDTPANRRAMPRADHGRWPAPAEVAGTILWLASPENRLTSGAVIPVHGRA
jgi:NAD(P)-dependent dehydrogenase (short-subunit alcohol dehydrogenase family)